MNPYLPLHFYRGLTNLEKKSLCTKGTAAIPWTSTAQLERALEEKYGIKLSLDAGWQQALEQAHRETEHAKTHGYAIVDFAQEEYPRDLFEVQDPPMCLMGRGTWKNEKRPVAIVGSRKATHYGLRATKEMCAVLSAYPVNIVSGLAFGIDSQAHRWALEYGATTTAFLAGGMCDIHPKSHRSLAQQILDEGGAYFTEQPFDNMPRPHFFPVRNRLIAGSSKEIIVVEAVKTGGAMITANLASGYNKNIHALPGAIYQPMSLGCNLLVNQDLAKAIAAIKDLPEQLFRDWRPVKVKIDSYDDLLKKMLRLFPVGRKVKPYEIGRALEVPNKQINRALRDLEALQLIEKLPKGFYGRK